MPFYMFFFFLFLLWFNCRRKFEFIVKNLIFLQNLQLFF